MAMAHPVPGLGKKKFFKHRPVASAPPDIIRLRKMLRPLEQEEMETIRKNAKEAWGGELARGNESVTTYNGLHAQKVLDEPTKGRVRPSSVHRLNNPHPPNVFLVTRLRRVDGYLDPHDAAAKRYEAAQRRLEQYVSQNETRVCRALGRPVPQSRPKTAEARVKMQTVIGQVPAQAAEAWIKLSNDQDKASIRKAFNQAHGDISKRLEATRSSPAAKPPATRKRAPPSFRPRLVQPPDQVYATSRWLKKAGHEESKAVRDLFEALRNAPPRYVPLEGPHFHITDYSTMFSTAPKKPQYDFQIHPEWHQPWHKKYETIRA